MKDFTVEINPAHKTIIALNKLRKEDPKFATMGVKQLFETAMLQSNLPVPTKEYAKRTFNILDQLFETKIKVPQIEEDIKVERLSTE